MLYPTWPLTLLPSLQIPAFQVDLVANHILLLQLLLCSALHGAGCNRAHFLTGWPRSPVFEADLGSRFAFRCDLTLPARSSSKTIDPTSHLYSSRSSHNSQEIIWKKNNQLILQSETSWHFYRNQMTLLNPTLKREDSGNYTCQQSISIESTNEGGSPLEGRISSARLVIRRDGHPPGRAKILISPPSRLANVSVRPSQVFVSVRWAVAEGGDGGTPITHFTLVYQQVLQAHFGNSNQGSKHGSAKRGDTATTATRILDVPEISKNFDGGHASKVQNEIIEHQHQQSTHLPLHISPAARQYFVYHLRPNALYQFKMWATNRLGSGEASILYISTNTVQKKSHNGINNSSSNQFHKEDIIAGEALLRSGTTRAAGISSPMITVVGYADDDLSATAWMIAVTMVFTTVVVLALLSCVLIYKEASNDDTALVSMYESELEPPTGRRSSAGFHSSAAAMQILLDPARSFRRFYRPQRCTGVLEERTVLLPEVGASDCNDNSEPALERLNNNSVLRPPDEEHLLGDDDDQRRPQH